MTIKGPIVDREQQTAAKASASAAVPVSIGAKFLTPPP